MSLEKTALNYFLPHKSKHNIMFSLRTNSRIFEIPHTNFKISFSQNFGISVIVNKTTTITVWYLNLDAINS